jgi:hypothetical protein
MLGVSLLALVADWPTLIAALEFNGTNTHITPVVKLHAGTPAQLAPPVA